MIDYKIKPNIIKEKSHTNIYTSTDSISFQTIIKRVTDILFACIGFLITLPLSIILATAIKLSSKGPVIYKQIRIGKNKTPFTIYKFRSMFIDAEINGPQLAKDNDSRVTKIGKIMRKWHLDEIPQFINVLIGDMSIVGPRPERLYYINKIISESPVYSQLLSLKPGLTSLGVVKYGYAKNINELIDRSKYDILYIKNANLLTDIKVILFTFKILLRGQGI